MKARTLTPLVLTAAVLCWALAPWPAPAAPVDPVAKLGDTASMNEDTGTYNLKVDSDGKKIRAADLDIIQGDPDTQYTVDTSVGSGTAQAPKRVATVDKKTGAVLYRVSGTMAGAGGGGQAKAWRTDYDYGGKRMVVYVNSESQDDNFVALGGDGTVTVLLPFADDDKKYKVRLSDGTGVGVVTFPDSDNEFWLGQTGPTTWTPSQTIRIHGTTEGADQIKVENIEVSPSGTALVNDTPDCPVTRVAVKSVAVKAANDFALTVYSDDKGLDVGAQPEWDDQGRREAAAFVRHATRTIQVKVTLTGPQGTVKISAKDGAVDAVTPKDVIFDAQGNAPNEVFDVEAPIGNAVDLKEWRWTWKYQIGAADAVDMTVTQLRIYVTLDTPSMPTGWKTFDSYYYVACKPSGATDASTAVSKIWTHMKGLVVTNARECGMGLYYPNIEGASTSPSQMLTIHNGTCGAWAFLMRAATGIHGVTVSAPEIEPDPAKVPAPLIPFRFLLVKGLTWAQQGSLGGNYPFKANILIHSGFKPADWAAPECREAGRNGQYTSAAAGAFNSHYLVRYNTKYFDPSYGLGGAGGFNSLSDYEATGLAGGGFCGIHQGAPGQPTKWAARKDDPNQQELRFKP